MPSIRIKQHRVTQTELTMGDCRLMNDSTQKISAAVTKHDPSRHPIKWDRSGVLVETKKLRSVQYQISWNGSIYTKKPKLFEKFHAVFANAKLYTHAGLGI